MTVSNDQPTVRLELDSRPEALTLVRAMLAGMAEPLALDAELLDDMKTAVSEACNNVVMHAYDGAYGAMTLCLYAEPGVLRVVVRDRGIGMSLPDDDDEVHGVGVPVIRALTRHAQFEAADGGGTQVSMEFDAIRNGRPLLQAPAAAAPEDHWFEQVSGDVIVSLSPVGFVGGVLGRLARAFAARARFSLDRFSDVYLVTDGLAAHVAQAASGSRIGFVISTHDRRLDLTIGPLRAGASSQLRDAPGGDAPRGAIAMLSDELEIRPTDQMESLHLVMIDHRRPISAVPV